MFKYLALIALFFSFTSFAQDECKSEISSCAVELQNPDPIQPVITTVDCGVEDSTLTDTFELINYRPVPARIKSLTLISDDGFPENAVTLTDLGTCRVGGELAPDGKPGSTCTIVISFQPCESGVIDRELVVEVDGQFPLTGDVDTTVAATLGYFADDSLSDTITICGIGSEGSIIANTCFTQQDNTFDYPIDIVLNNDNTLAYVANSDNSNDPSSYYVLSICKLTPHGVLDGPCKDSGITIFELQYTGIRINPQNTQMYITNSIFPPDGDYLTISICDIDTNGDLSGCKIDYGCTTSTVSDPTSCSPSSGGSPSNCCILDPTTSEDGIITLNEPNGRMAFSADGTIAFVPNFVNNDGKEQNSNVSVCEVDSTTGALKNCEINYGYDTTQPPPSHPPFTYLQGIDLSPDGEHLYLANNFYDKYPDNFSCDSNGETCPGGTITICDITSTTTPPTLTNCTKNNGSDSNNSRTFEFDTNSTNIFTNSANGYAYIPNGCVNGYQYETYGFLCQAQAPSTISVCPIDPSKPGGFGACTTSAADDLLNTVDSAWIANFPPISE